MIENAGDLVTDFVEAMNHHARRPIHREQITYDSWAAPHEPKGLLPSMAAVYVFSLASDSKAPAGPHRAIRALGSSTHRSESEWLASVADAATRTYAFLADVAHTGKQLEESIRAALLAGEAVAITLLARRAS